jgi:hypothetical protein
MSPPPAATCIAFMPQDNNIAAIGREDYVIHIFNMRHGEVIYLEFCDPKFKV